MIRLVLNRETGTTGESDEGSFDIEDDYSKTDTQYRWHDIQNQIWWIWLYIVKCDIIECQGYHPSDPYAQTKDTRLREVPQNVSHEKTADECDDDNILYQRLRHSFQEYEEGFDHEEDESGSPPTDQHNTAPVDVHSEDHEDDAYYSNRDGIW